jgi:hypothetical protein
MAAALEVSQGYVSRLERQNDMLISTLQAYVRVLGGTVEIRTRIGDSEDRLYQFGPSEPAP